ncbi:uncharacterized protein K441DRAFT_652235 [Cenococcum geophilum 1.58]|uniref:uncharacterized protein n=1 Tax=Cenococcum geophilum 1.58 TaxID=794803 RepID=UPI00358E573A|nr:hypothetical protein K441DRAFT_652235 [Cenococcum geophilum 1.58]
MDVSLPNPRPIRTHANRTGTTSSRDPPTNPLRHMHRRRARIRLGLRNARPIMLHAPHHLLRNNQPPTIAAAQAHLIQICRAPLVPAPRLPRKPVRPQRVRVRDLRGRVAGPRGGLQRAKRERVRGFGACLRAVVGAGRATRVSVARAAEGAEERGLGSISCSTWWRSLAATALRRRSRRR